MAYHAPLFTLMVVVVAQLLRGADTCNGDDFSDATEACISRIKHRREVSSVSKTFSQSRDDCTTILCALNSTTLSGLSNCAVTNSFLKDDASAAESTCRQSLNNSASALWISQWPVIPPSCRTTSASLIVTKRCLEALPCRTSGAAALCSPACVAHSMICVLSYLCSSPMELETFSSADTDVCALLVPAQWALCSAQQLSSDPGVNPAARLLQLCSNATILISGAGDDDDAVQKYKAWIVAAAVVGGVCVVLSVVSLRLGCRKSKKDLALPPSETNRAAVVQRYQKRERHSDSVQIPEESRLQVVEAGSSREFDDSEYWHDDPPTIVPKELGPTISRLSALSEWVATHTPSKLVERTKFDYDAADQVRGLTNNPAAFFFEEDEPAVGPTPGERTSSGATTKSDDIFDDDAPRLMIPVYAESKKGLAIKRKQNNRDQRSATSLRDLQFEVSDDRLQTHAPANAVQPFTPMSDDESPSDLVYQPNASRPTSPSSQSSDASVHNFGDDYWDEEAESLAAEALQWHKGHATLASPHSQRRPSSHQGSAQPQSDSLVAIPAGEVMSRKDIVSMITSGRFVRGRLLGRGAIGSVYQAVARNVPALSSPCCIALKEIDVQKCTREELGKMIARFNFLCRISHRHLAEIYLVRYDTASLALHVWMEYVGGPTLNAYARRFIAYPPPAAADGNVVVVGDNPTATVGHRPSTVGSSNTQPIDAPEQQAVKWFGQLLSALSYLHKKGIIHRDVKGGNVLLTADLRSAKLIDLDCCFIVPTAVAKMAQHGASSAVTAELATFLSAPPSVVGSPLWMPPEILASIDTPSAATDLWSLGITLAEYLMGGEVPWPPFESTFLAMQYIITSRSPILRRSNVSENCRNFLAACWSVDVSQRKSSMEFRSHPWLQRSRPSSFRLSRSMEESSSRQLSSRTQASSQDAGNHGALESQATHGIQRVVDSASTVPADLEAEIRRLEAELDAM